MRCVYNYDDYIRRKLAGEDVVSATTLYGINAKDRNTEDFMVVVLNETDCSFYKYVLKDGRFHITDYQEVIQHSMADSLPLSMVQNMDTIKWWNHVFFERNGICTFDTHYDTLRIAEDSEMTFKELMERIAQSLPSLGLPPITTQVYLTGDLACPVFRYVLQQANPSYNVWALPAISENVSLDENEVVPVPMELFDQLAINANGGMAFSLFARAPIIVNMPILSKDSEMAMDTKWEDMLVDQQTDYTVGNFDFKVIRLRVECDPFQNAFLSCQDTRGNRKVRQIK